MASLSSPSASGRELVEQRHDDRRGEDLHEEREGDHGHPGVDPGEPARVCEQGQEAGHERQADDGPDRQPFQQVEDEGAGLVRLKPKRSSMTKTA